MKEILNYYAISRDEWKSYYSNAVVPLNAEELDSVKSFNDRISLQDVQDVYIPLTHLIHVYRKQYESLQLSKSLFMHSYSGLPTFIIGVAGSVAVGKSTTARLLQMMLTRTFKRRNVQLVTTDGFLYSTAELEKRGLLDRKGFPESYDMERLLTFLNDIKSGKDNVKIPVYSHEIYDIVPDTYETVGEVDILIVEGINVLQLPANQQIYVSDFFDFSIYVDADSKLIEKWYMERFGMLLDTAFREPDNFYYPYAMGKREDAFAMAQEVWRDVNLKNLEEYILPTRNRADLILHKTEKHIIDEIYLRKY